MNNPFSYIAAKVCPAEGEAFIGRKRQLQEVLELINRDNPYHISIFGLPHIGKSSFLKRLYNELSQKDDILPIRVPAFSDGDFKGNIIDIIDALAFVIDYEVEVTEFSSAEEIIAELEKVLREASANKRVLLLLDEFERISGYSHSGGDDTNCWSQEEYELFLRLLMDKTIDFVVCTASRPKMSNILSRFKPIINPFVSVLLPSFDDTEMKEFFDIFDREGALLNGMNLRDNASAFGEILRICGRSPYLLTLMGNEIFENAKKTNGARKSVRPLYENIKEQVIAHFDDTIITIVREERKKLRSFSHIVKCYFGQFEDYQDIKERCVALGYLDLCLKNSPYTFNERIYEFDDKDDRFSVCDENGRILELQEKSQVGLVYTTVSPLFVDYLFSVDTPIGITYPVVPLNLICDTRDLLTGLIHTMRDITKKEFSLPTPKGLGDNWNDELACLYYSQLNIRGANVTEAFINRDMTQTRPERRYSCWTKKGGICNMETPEMPTNNQSANNYYISLQRNITNNWSNYMATRTIKISLEGLKFVTNEFLENRNTVMPALDPINMNDQASIFCKYWSADANRTVAKNVSFSKYFGGLPGGEAELRRIMGQLRDLRNKISHYVRHGYDEALLQQEKEDCRRLIRSMYYYLFAKKPYTP